jgi:hypothetical protein
MLIFSNACLCFHNTPQNVADVDMAAHVQRLRAKFRAVTSMLGISVKFPLHMSGRISDGETAGGVGALSF